MPPAPEAPPAPTPVPPAGARAARRALGKRRERAWPYLVVVAAAAAAIVWPLVRESRRAHAMIEREHEALAALDRVAAAEESLREATGRYGWVEDLERSGRLGGLRVAGPDAGRYVASPGYRVDVLLPWGRLGGRGIGLVPRGGAHPPDDDLSTSHFAVVARPLEPGTSGWRAFYMDEEAVLFLNEGVTDADSAALNPLPETKVHASQPMQSGRALLWQRADEAVPSDD